MKPKYLLALAILAIALLVAYKFRRQTGLARIWQKLATAATSSKPKPETPEQTLDRFRLESHELAQQFLMSTVGFKRTQWLIANVDSGVVTDWKASAEVEFSGNPSGVETRTVYFAYSTDPTGKILQVGPDWEHDNNETNVVFWLQRGVTNKSTVPSKPPSKG